MRFSFLLPMLFVAGACATLPPASTHRDTIDLVARDYVVQTLDIGERDPGFVDAYYGPAEYQAAAKAAPRDLAALKTASDALFARLDALRPADPLEVRRLSFLRGQLLAERTRLRMLSGEKLTFLEEARGLFGVAPELKPLSAYDPVLARIAALTPPATVRLPNGSMPMRTGSIFPPIGSSP